MFERYAIGQYFNDQETGPSGLLDEGKAVQTMTASRPAPIANGLASKRSAPAKATRLAAVKTVPATQRKAAVAHKKSSTTHVAAKSHSRHRVGVTKRKLAHAVKTGVTIASFGVVAVSRAAKERFGAGPPSARRIIKTQPLRPEGGLVPKRCLDEPTRSPGGVAVARPIRMMRRG